MSGTLRPWNLHFRHISVHCDISKPIVFTPGSPNMSQELIVLLRIAITLTPRSVSVLMRPLAAFVTTVLVNISISATWS